MEPKVSVYITTHNRGVKLIDAVMSVIEQTYSSIEIIISDDGSVDNTKDLVEKLCARYSNIIYTRSETPKGANHARNKALFLATGKFITGLDDDDVFTSDRIEKFVTHWDDNFSFICDNFINVYDCDVEDIHYKSTDKGYIIGEKEILFNNVASNQVFTLTERLLHIDGFNEKLKRLQDWDCWIRLVCTFGSAKRYNWKTYKMFHDHSVRVSKNIDFNTAYQVLVSENIGLYSSIIGYCFADKYLLKIKKPSLFDFLFAKSKWEFKIMIKNFLGL